MSSTYIQSLPYQRVVAVNTWSRDEIGPLSFCEDVIISQGSKLAVLHSPTEGVHKDHLELKFGRLRRFENG